MQYFTVELDTTIRNAYVVEAENAAEAEQLAKVAEEISSSITSIPANRSNAKLVNANKQKSVHITQLANKRAYDNFCDQALQ